MSRHSGASMERSGLTASSRPAPLASMCCMTTATPSTTTGKPCGGGRRGPAPKVADHIHLWPSGRSWQTQRLTGGRARRTHSARATGSVACRRGDRRGGGPRAAAAAAPNLRARSSSHDDDCTVHCCRCTEGLDRSERLAAVASRARDGGEPTGASERRRHIACSIGTVDAGAAGGIKLGQRRERFPGSRYTHTPRPTKQGRKSNRFTPHRIRHFPPSATSHVRPAGLIEMTTTQFVN